MKIMAFDGKEKLKRHNEIFHEDSNRAFEMNVRLTSS